MPDQKSPVNIDKPTNGKDFLPMPTPSKAANPSDHGKGLLDQAKSVASEAYDTVAETATSKLEDQKAGLKSSLTTVADSIRKAGDSLGETRDQNYLTEFSAEYAKTAAKKIESVADYFERSDFRSMARDAENYARRNPAIFLGSAFVLGVLAARFFKSSPIPQVGQGAAARSREFDEGTVAKARSAEGGSAAF